MDKTPDRAGMNLIRGGQSEPVYRIDRYQDLSALAPTSRGKSVVVLRPSKDEWTHALRREVSGVAKVAPGGNVVVELNPSHDPSTPQFAA